MEGTYWLYVNRRPATSVLALFMSPWYTLWGEEGAEEQPLSHVAYTDHVNASRGIVVFYGETRLFFIQLRRISRLINDPLSKTPPGLSFNPPSFLFVAEGATGGSFPFVIWRMEFSNSFISPLFRPGIKFDSFARPTFSTLLDFSLNH